MVRAPLGVHEHVAGVWGYAEIGHSLFPSLVSCGTATPKSEQQVNASVPLSTLTCCQYSAFGQNAGTGTFWTHTHKKNRFLADRACTEHKPMLTRLNLYDQIFG